MKKLLFLIVVLALTLGTLASCDIVNNLPFLPDSGENGGEGNEGEGNGGNEVVETDIQEAVKELEDQYSDDNGTSTANDFELIAQMKINGTMFYVNWATDNDSVKLELVDGLWCVDVPEDISENTTYTLTATITTDGGQNAEVEFTRVLVASFGMISNPEVGKAYKFALLHGNEKQVVYFDGNNYNNYAWYLAYTADQLAAVDVYLETVEGVEGAYRLYYDKDGEKTYIVAYPRDGDTTKGTLKLDTVTPEEYYTWDSEYNTLVYTSVTGESFYIGSSGTYKSISLSGYSYINGATSYVAHLYGAGGEKEELPEQILPEVPENYTSADLVDALYKLESGQTLEGPYELTGVITSIKYAYDPAYNNVSVVIVVEGREDKPVLAYRLNGGEDLKVGDTITIFAGLTNYNGTFETTSGGVIREVVEGDGTVPEQPEVSSDAESILNALYALADGESLSGSFTLTGKITALDSYNNPTIVVEGFENKPVYCYKLVVDKAVGDTITVTATSMKNYSGKYEFMNCTLVENTEDTPSTPSNLGIVDNPEVGVAYKFGLFHGNEDATVYFNGQNYNSYAWYLAYAAEGVDVYLEAVENVDNAYRLFFYNGEAKTYIVAYPRDGDTTKGTLKLDTEVPETYYTFNTEYNTLVYTSTTGEQFYLGSSGTYKSISCSAISYITESTSYVAHLYAEGATGEEVPHTHEFVNGKCACGEVDPDYVAPDMPTDGNYTIPQVLAAAEGTEVNVTGTVESFYYAWDDNYGNCSVYIVDEDGNKLLCFRLATKVEIGDNITVTGTVTAYNGVNQIAAGCTAVINTSEDSGSTETPEGPTEMTITEALTAASGTQVTIKGTVVSFYEDWSSYGNCSPYIADEAGNKILVFRTTTHVYVGDQITVTGTVTAYNNVNQIAQDGSVVTIDVAHTCSYTDETCTEASTCTSCGATADGSVALGHTEANAESKCDRCGLDLSVNYVTNELSFSDVANRTTFTTAQQVWVANGVTLTNDKGSSTTNVADYSNPARFYKSSMVTVACTGMTKIDFVCNSSSYATALQSSIAADDNYTVTVSGSTVTVSFVEAVDSFVIDSLTGGQVRMNSLTVTSIG